MLIDVQQMDNLGAASSRLPKLLQLQSHLTAASNAVDYKDSAMCPNPFLHEASRQSSQAEHSLQRHQPPVSNQCQGEATSVSMLSGDKAGAVSLGSSSQPLHQLRPQHADCEAPLQRLGIRQLQELLGMKSLGKSLHQQHDGQCATKIATSSTTSSTSSLLPQKRPHASVSALLQPSVPAAAFAGLSSAPASGQLLVRPSLTDSQTALWTQPEALEALRSQRASLTGMLRTQSTSQSCGQSPQQQQTAFLRPFQTALQGPQRDSRQANFWAHPQVSPLHAFFRASVRRSPFTLPSMWTWVAGQQPCQHTSRQQLQAEQLNAQQGSADGCMSKPGGLTFCPSKPLA